MKRKPSFSFKKIFIASVLSLSCLFCETASSYVPVSHAQEVTTDPGSSLSLADVSEVRIDTAGRILRLYGDETQIYQVPVNVQADCTLILDHLINDASITIANGTSVTILVRGSNRIKDIIANGGDTTMLTLRGDSGDAALIAGSVACSTGGTTETGAQLLIDHCTLTCQNIGCGGNGYDGSYYGVSSTVANATPGSNASPQVTIRSSDVTVSGSIACGGNGAVSYGSWYAQTSAAGNSGTVWIDHSRVSAGGSIAVGGKGGDGLMDNGYFDRPAGTTQSSSPVRITDQSVVTVTGNVATQQSLPQISKGGSQRGLHGVRVEVTDSTLSAKDIASGGDGHRLVLSEISSVNGGNYNIYGTAGGNGGELIADHAVIICDTAVCGGNAGDYKKYQVNPNGQYSGDYENVNHPSDGNGGSIRSTESEWTIGVNVGNRGNHWASAPNPSVYSNQQFSGGTISGTVCGDVITTDLTSILDGGFAAITEIRNSEEASCAKSVFITDETMSGSIVTATANDLTGTVRLGGNGEWKTYLAIGKQDVTLTGSHSYSASARIRRSDDLNVFQMDEYGSLNLAASDAVIGEASYSYLGEIHPYDGDYTISGAGSAHDLEVEAGDHLLIFRESQLNSLTIRGTARVTLRLDDIVRINRISVADQASLTINDNDKLTYGSCQGKIYHSAGMQLYPLELIPETAAAFDLDINGKERHVQPDGDGLRFLVPEGDLALRIKSGSFLFSDNRTIHAPQQIRQADMLLLLDCSTEPIAIDETTVTYGEEQITSCARVCLIQSATPGSIRVNRKDARILLRDLSPDTQIQVTEGFVGELTDPDGNIVRPVTISVGQPDHPVSYELDGSIYQTVTDADGCMTFLATGGDHQFRLIVNDQSYWLPKAFHEDFPADGNDWQMSYAIDDLSDKEPAADVTPPSTGAADTPPGSSDDPPVTPPADPPESDTNSNTSASSGGSTSGGTVSGGTASGGTASGGTVSDTAGSTGAASGTDDPRQDGSTAMPQIRISHKGVQLTASDHITKDIYYTKKPVVFDIDIPETAICNYKLVHMDEEETTVDWNRLNTRQLAVSADPADTRAVRVIFQIMQGSNIQQQQTTYFVVDDKKPSVTGIKHLHFYHKSRRIRISDSSGLQEIRLNGTKVRSDFTVKDRGIYLLKVTDHAGNSRTRIFAIW